MSHEPSRLAEGMATVPRAPEADPINDVGRVVARTADLAVDLCFATPF